MLYAEVLRPFTRKIPDKIICCKTCGIAYNRKDYKILYDNKKIAYFHFFMNKKKKPMRLCHNCFTKVLMRVCRDTGVPNIIVNCRDVRTDFRLNVEYNPDVSLGFDDFNLG